VFVPGSQPPAANTENDISFKGEKRMIFTEERKKILEMLQEGKLTPEAAAQLLGALGDEAEQPSGPKQPHHPSEPSSSDVPTVGKPRWLRVRVTDTDTGRPRVNVRVPMALVDMGLKLGARFAPEVDGIDIKALLEAAQTESVGPFVDVYDEEDGERVEIFLE
jgi:hypothetical protein